MISRDNSNNSQGEETSSSPHRRVPGVGNPSRSRPSRQQAHPGVQPPHHGQQPFSDAGYRQAYPAADAAGFSTTHPHPPAQPQHHGQHHTQRIGGGGMNYSGGSTGFRGGHHPQHPPYAQPNQPIHRPPHYQQHGQYAPQHEGPQGMMQPPVGMQPPQPHGMMQPPPPAFHQNTQQPPLQGGPPPPHHHPNAALPQPRLQAPPQPREQAQQRNPSERPIFRLSVRLIDAYRNINTVYYEESETRRAARAAERAARAAERANEQPQQQQQASDNQQASNSQQHPAWDDENFDYIITDGEKFFNDRYTIRERIGRGSFGQVVRARDNVTNRDVAIKIIKSRRPFRVQARTEIELLSDLCDMDRDDQYNIVRLETHFVYRDHQCLVFEMLSLNLYELLRNTSFGGVSLNLIRKFAKQILKALSFLARPDVDIIHCDLKPENILLRHPKRSGIKVVDFGSSCRSNRQTYSYIQSRFYRSPEVMLGLPYSTAIDMWSLGCILVEMHTGEPLFSGSDQFDQMQKIIHVLGMVPSGMIEISSDRDRDRFFERRNNNGVNSWALRQPAETSGPVLPPSQNPPASLSQKVRAETMRRRQYDESLESYKMFEDLIYHMLTYDPQERIKPVDALMHPFILNGEHISGSSNRQGGGGSAGSSNKGGGGTSKSSSPRKPQGT